MILLPVAVVWGGYLLVCYGIGEVRGGGIGLLDWANPAKVGKVVNTFGNTANGKGKDSGTNLATDTVVGRAITQQPNLGKDTVVGRAITGQQQ